MTTKVEDRSFTPLTVPFHSLEQGECFRFCSEGTPAMRIGNNTDSGAHYMFLTGPIAFAVNRVISTEEVIPIDAHIILG